MPEGEDSRWSEVPERALWPLEGLLFDRMKEGRGGSGCMVVAGAVSGTERSQLICLEPGKKGGGVKGWERSGVMGSDPPCRQVCCGLMRSGLELVGAGGRCLLAWATKEHGLFQAWPRGNCSEVRRMLTLPVGEVGGMGLAVWQWQFSQKTCLSLETEGGETVSEWVAVSVWKGGSGGHGGEAWRGGKQGELDQKKEIGHMEMRL